MYQPAFEGPIKGWGVNFCKKNYWRVKVTMPWEDLLQELAVAFLRVKQKYPETESPQHFMSLFQRSWINKFNDFSIEDTHVRKIFVDRFIHDGIDDTEPDTIGELDHDGELSIKLKQAPREVMMVLNLILNAPAELVVVAMQGWNGKDARCRAGGSKRINLMLGLPTDFDVMNMVRNYFY